LPFAEFAFIMSAMPHFARPPDDISEASFYHTMDLPGRGLVTGPWDLRGRLDKYLGRVDYAGSTVLEIGPASGCLTYEMERRGATVVAVDLPVTESYDCFPLSPCNQVEALHPGQRQRQLRRNGFWTAHRAFGSRARLIEVNVDDLDPSVAGFDVAVVANVLQHRMNPVGMLLNISARARTIVITESDWLDGTNDAAPLMQLVTPNLRAGNPLSWFLLSPQLVEDVLALRGFDIVSRDIHHQPYQPDPSQPANLIRHYTITATRSSF
jgi:O-methyltransferase